ncbi:hypothetical protein RhiirA5_385558 [Rhizophagus irregularis]|uniref:Uncharacterized protein n=1 Tax=Rhizophagus irregularis TaxID=588596 RepID=A0A2N0NNF5_9GLOM|nr:hypothetical protein RhiirA5_385558 [Rhizophagus irregularis]
MKLGPASRLADFIKECKERKKRSFTSYKTQKDLKEVLAKYGIDGNGIGAIHQFPPSQMMVYQVICYHNISVRYHKPDIDVIETPLDLDILSAFLDVTFEVSAILVFQ